MYPSLFSALFIWLACVLSHAVFYRTSAKNDVARVWQDATRLPSLALCFMGPLWWWGEAEGHQAAGRALLEGSIVFLLGACFIQGGLAVGRRRAGPPRVPLRGLAYFTLSLISFGVALASSLHPRLIVLPLLCTALLFWSLNLARLALLYFSQASGPFWSAVRNQIFPWVLPFIAVASVLYLQSEWEHMRVGKASVFHVRLVLQALSLAILGEGLLATAYFLKIRYWVEGAWFRDLFRTFLFLSIAWNYLSQATGRNLGDLLVGSAFLAVGLGFALKPTVGNFAAGLVLRLSPSFDIGDYISVKKHFGRVVSIDWRSTALRGRDGDLLVLPNVLMAKESLINHSLSLSEQASWGTVSLDANVSPHRAKACLLKALRSHALVLQSPEPQVFLAGFKEWGVEYRFLYRFHDPEAQPDTESAVLAHVDYCLRRESLHLASPVSRAFVSTVSDSQGERVYDLTPV